MSGRRRWLAVEALALRTPLTGVGNYASKLLKHLLMLHPDVGLDLLTMGGVELDLREVLGGVDGEDRIRVHRHHLPPNAYRVAVAGRVAPPIESLFPVVRDAEAVLYPNFVRYPSRLLLPEAVIVYDATFRDFPEDKSRWFNLIWGRLTQQALSSPAAPVTISHAAANDIGRHFRVEAPLQVIYPGVVQAPRRSTASRRHVLVIGTESPRKNVNSVIDAHGRMDPRTRPELIVVGRGHSARAGVRTVGYVSDEELADLLATARALVAPSLSEGFDLPVLEAMTCGVPVVASNIPVHREVLGADWPWLFEPHDTRDLIVRLEAAVSSTALPKFDRPERFDWDRAANAVGELLRL